MGRGVVNGKIKLNNYPFYNPRISVASICLSVLSFKFESHEKLHFSACKCISVLCKSRLSSKIIMSL